MLEQLNTTKLRIISYNCNSIRKKVHIIRGLIDKCDILLVQEILLLPDDVNFMYIWVERKL
jgi:exonuclease III